MTRTMAERIARARERATRRETLYVLLNRADRLSAAEAALLVEYTRAELDSADELRRTVQGQQTAMQDAIARTRAAEAAIVEVEADRDQAQSAVERVRGWCDQLDARVRELTKEPTAEHPAAAGIRYVLDHQEQ